MNKNKNFQYAALRGRCAAARPAHVCHMKNNIKNHFQKQKTTQNINKHSKNVLKMIMQTLLFFILHLKSERSGRSKNSCKFSSFSFSRDKQTHRQYQIVYILDAHFSATVRRRDSGLFAVSRCIYPLHRRTHRLFAHAQLHCAYTIDHISCAFKMFQYLQLLAYKTQNLDRANA